ncbi:MAG: DUF3048 domain-containing protein [Actinomycetales bacterium]|nr:DUF3048 domain-containing protein [Candidatus Phosphoribacter baldrii]
MAAVALASSRVYVRPARLGPARTRSPGARDFATRRRDNRADRHAQGDQLPTMLPTAGQPLLGGAPVLAVKVDNTARARPRVGLDAADVVYVEPVEAGLTRLMAIFVSTKPAQVGPIRSARESDAALLANYGRVAFAYSGASPITAAAIGGGRQVNVSMDSGGGGFRRDSSRRAPYNVIGGPVALCLAAGGSAPAGDIGFHVGPLAPGRDPEAA